MCIRDRLYRPAYETALAAVDHQFSLLMDRLERRGVLRNAIVVLLSDHGEAFGDDADSLLGSNARAIGSSVWGHGSSVMSRPQYQVVLALRWFGQDGQIALPGRHEAPASLEDVRPTVLDLLGVEVPLRVDGVSLAGVIRGDPAPAALRERVRFIESGFNPPSVLQGNYDARGALQEAGAYFELEPESGWVQLKEDRLGKLLRTKERAAIYGSYQLAALVGTDGRPSYYLDTLSDPDPPVPLHTPPDPRMQPDAARLWEALHARFAGEMP
jgi:hypothetical protein